MDASKLDQASFAEIRDRLDEIAKAVRAEDMPLDSALDLYDEAVKLGMRATELLEAVDAPAPDTVSPAE